MSLLSTIACHVWFLLSPVMCFVIIGSPHPFDVLIGVAWCMFGGLSAMAAD